MRETPVHAVFFYWNFRRKDGLLDKDLHRESGQREFAGKRKERSRYLPASLSRKSHERKMLRDSLDETYVDLRQRLISIRLNLNSARPSVGLEAQGCHPPT
jgi:hypothetical protein